MRSLVIAVGLGLMVACGRPAPRSHAPQGTAPPPACAGSPLRAYDEKPGVLQRIFVDLPIDGRPMPFFVDTGSEQTFRRVDSGSPTGAKETKTTISCIDAGLAFSHASVFRTTPDGHSVGGVVGTDLLAVGGVLDLRIRDSRFVWSREATGLPPGTVTLPATFVRSNDPFARGKIVLDDVALDGRKTRLLFDTGSPHVVIVSNEPRANETEVQSFDGTGAPVRFYESTIDIAFAGGPPRRVIVDRAAKFPTLERVFAAIGGAEIAGVLGLGALGHERIVIAKDAVRFVP